MKTYDLAIIGSGPGGYVAGLYASRCKMRVCVIEQGLVGGTCLNSGCIPTKSLTNSASVLSTVKGAGEFGIHVDGFNLDYGGVLRRKDEVVTRLRTGIETLLRANKVDLIRGRAHVTGTDTVGIEGAEGVKAAHIVIATGSRISSLPNIPVDEGAILSSDGILNVSAVPRSIIVIGGGVVGCEFASLFNVFGSRVTVVEMADRLLPAMSLEASKKIESIFKRRGMDIHTAACVEKAYGTDTAKVVLSGGAVIEAEKALVSIGRTPAIDGLGIEELGIGNHLGRIAVDDHLRTSVPNIFAIGDCAPGPQLAHKASYDAVLACDNMLGNARKADYSAIPNCIWTDPEIASVGLPEEAAKSTYPDARTAKFPYLASGKAYIEGKPEGYIKIIGTPDGSILGVEILGRHACELIGEAALAKASRIGIKQWSLAVHGHPTLSEILQESARVFCGTPIHSIG